MVIKYKKFICCGLLALQIFGLAVSSAWAQRITPSAALNDTLVSVTCQKDLPVLLGVKIDPKNPVEVQFIVDYGSSRSCDETELRRLVGYFLAALALPQDSLWVNLSPYEKDRVCGRGIDITDLGHDMLGQDYFLKQLAASLTYPETVQGKEYWDMINSSLRGAQALQKVWITSDKSLVYENETTAVVKEATLKVLTDFDYRTEFLHEKGKDEKAAGAKAFKDTILPLIQKDVSYGNNFARLRQINNAFILASWFKRRFRDSFYRYYIDSNKTKGIDNVAANEKGKIFDRYVESFTKGVYDYVKKEQFGNHISRTQYFSGGVTLKDNLRVEYPGAGAVGEVIKNAEEIDTVRFVPVLSDRLPGHSESTNSAVHLAIADAKKLIQSGAVMPARALLNELLNDLHAIRNDNAKYEAIMDNWQTKYTHPYDLQLSDLDKAIESAGLLLDAAPVPRGKIRNIPQTAKEYLESQVPLLEDALRRLDISLPETDKLEEEDIVFYAKEAMNTLVRYRESKSNTHPKLQALVAQGIISDDIRLAIEGLNSFNVDDLAEGLLLIILDYSKHKIAKGNIKTLFKNLITADEVRSVLRDFKDIPDFVVLHACVHNPSDPRKSLRQVIGDKNTILAEPEFKDIPASAVLHACVGNPSDPRKFLRQVITNKNAILAEPEFKDIPAYIVLYACVNHPSDPRKFLRQVIADKNAILAEPEFNNIPDTVVLDACVHNPSDPRRFLRRYKRGEVTVGNSYYRNSNGSSNEDVGGVVLADKHLIIESSNSSFVLSDVQLQSFKNALGLGFIIIKRTPLNQ